MFRLRSMKMKTLVEACETNDIDSVHALLQKLYPVDEVNEYGQSALSIVCNAGYFHIAEVLLQMNASVEFKNPKSGLTPMMEAASSGHDEIINLLHDYGGDVNTTCNLGCTSLMYACNENHVEVVKELIKCGANLNILNGTGHTALMIAINQGYRMISKILMSHGAIINNCSTLNKNALSLATEKGHLDIINLLLSSNRFDPNEMFDALKSAVKKGFLNIGLALIKSGAQVNMESETDDDEPLLVLAASGGHMRFVLLLIENGCTDLEVTDYEGCTPLMKAAMNGHEHVVKKLLSLGANKDALTNYSNETALALAASKGHKYVVDCLIVNGANLDLGDVTPLTHLARIGNKLLVNYLLHSGANVNAVTPTGETPLTLACEYGHTDIAEVLIQFGANVEHQCVSGQTPLMKACRDGYLHTVVLLVSENADVNKVNNIDGHTPLSIACANGRTDIVEYLLNNDADPFHKLTDGTTMVLLAAKRKHMHIVRMLTTNLTSITDVKGLPPLVRSKSAENLQHLNDDELQTKTLELCIEVGTKCGKGRQANREKIESIINNIVQEHLSKIRRFHRVCEKIRIEEELKYYS